MKKKTLSPREQECYNIIVEYYKENRVIPTHVYIADKLGVGRQYATLLIANLITKGSLKKTPRHGLYALV
jgi:Mn-dependent DtxR family transcriptional regulator